MTASGNQKLWDAMRADPTPRTAAEWAARAGVERSTSDIRLRYWRNAGLVRREPGKPARHHIPDGSAVPATVPSFTRAGAPIRPCQPATAPLWRAMRALSKRGGFDAPMLAMIAETSPGYALNYVNRLRRAGYVRLLTTHARPFARFRLVRDTGPLPPRIAVGPGMRVVIDENNGARVDISPGRVSLRSKPALVEAGGGVG